MSIHSHTHTTEFSPFTPTPSDALPLEAGDHLDREEFERRYTAMPNLKKAELLEGVVYMPSPVSADFHGSPHASLNWWLATYRIQTPGTQLADNATIRLPGDNEPQPDVLLRILPQCGGATRSVAGFVEGPPELVVEIAASSASYDLHNKLRVYQQFGVREYIVWRVRDRVLDWFILREGRYEPLPRTAGAYHSEIFPGLRLDPDALLRDDSQQVLTVLQAGLASPEHAAFVKQLQQAQTNKPN